jgi:dolichol-phosphate mannosyltransferase
MYPRVQDALTPQRSGDTDFRVADALSLEESGVSIIVMAYNEEPSIARVVQEISSVLSRSEFAYQIIVVNDGSRDSTGSIADHLAATLPNTEVIHHATNAGIGEVYRSGFAAARGAFVTFLPADGQFSAAIVPAFARLMVDADMVLGYLPDQVGSRSVTGKILSSAERTLFRLMFGALPRFQGVLMFRRTLLEELHVRPGGRGWGVLMELVVKATRSGRPMKSVPTELRPRHSGNSKVNNVATVWANMKQAVTLWRTL